MLTPIDIDPETFLRDHCSLPALPEIVYKLQHEIQGQQARVSDVADLINTDPALLTQVLKVVNSAYYGLPKEVFNVKYAIAFLGLYEIYRMVLSLSVVNTLAIDEKQELNDFWLHSFHTALCTKYLARQYQAHLPFDEFWVPAILHDIGKLVYLKFFPVHYKTMKAYCQENGCLFTEAENHFSLPKSSYFGTMLCDRWRLPDKARRACECHSFFDLVAENSCQSLKRFDRLITLGNLCSVICTNGLRNKARKKLEETIMEGLGCSKEAFLLMMGDILELKMHAEKFLD
jgi:HD-like signal output (HDOD) protein